MKNDANKKINKVDLWVDIILFFGFLIRLIYVMNTSVYVRGHDVGNYTSLTDGLINNGHLGYIEYIAKFGHLPDFDPFEVFAFYHPPLHHVIAAGVLRISVNLGATITEAFKNVQLLTCFYSALTMFFAYLILEKIAKKQWQIIIPLAMFCFHPSLIYMSASINNDMLATLLEMVAIYCAINWIQSNFKLIHLLLTGLFIGLGMCAKLTAGMLAFPVGLIMLMRLIEMAKQSKLGKCIWHYILFAIVTVPIGMWWTIRNWVLFRQTPGVPTGDETDFKYVGNVPILEQFSIPKNWGLDYPFHSPKASYCSNSWLIMFRTAMFTEMWPDPGVILLNICRALFVGSVVLGIGCAILTIIVNIVEIVRGNKYIGAFFLCGYITFILSFIAFVIKYPFTCSSDFRYIATVLIYSSLSIVQACYVFKRRKNLVSEQ